MNKELTIQEVQALYENEKRENAFKTRRIRLLEKILTDNGIPFPEDKLGAGLGELPDVPEEELKENEI